MASSLSRRILNPKLFALIPRNPSPLFPISCPKPYSTISIPKPYHISNPFFLMRRNLSSAPPEGATSVANGGEAIRTEEFKHQEITGPTVERDESALANETRQVLDKMRKSMYDLSSAMAMLGLANLGLGTWIAVTLPYPVEEVWIQGIAAFAFPFSTAFLMRQALKPMTFFRKMEEQGRLQVLTLSMQQAKGMNLLLQRTRLSALCCVVGVSAGSLYAIWTR